MALRDKLGKDFVTTVEIDPPRGVAIEKTIGKASVLRGFDAINIADSPMARVRMSPVALAHLLRECMGIDTILHMTCRDRNLLSLQSDLLGAYALGVHNVLALTGDPVSIGDYPQATGVFDVTSEGLVRVISRLNSGMDLAGNSLSEPPKFCIGVAVNPASSDLPKEIGRLEKKMEAGAHFALTQPVYDLAVLEKFAKLVDGSKIPVLVGVLPLKSSKHAEYLHNEVPGIDVPEHIRMRIRNSDEEHARATGVDIAVEFLRNAKDLAAGAYFMPPFGDYEMAAQIVAEAL
ncbi:MAG: methylenetetrahydrofolate reductase [Armatimonadota bacterium]